MDNNPPTTVSRTAAEQAQIAALERELAQLTAVNSTLRAQLKSAQDDIEQEAMQRSGVLNDETIRSIQAAVGQGLSVSATCKALGVSRATYYRHRDRLAIPSPASE